MSLPGSPRPGGGGGGGGGGVGSPGGLGNSSTSGGAPFASPSAASVVTAATGGTDSASTAGGGPKTKSALVVAAEALDRRQALLAGYLRKHNSQGRWQKRYFEIVGHYWVYYKSHSSDEMLCAMDLWRASTPELTPNHSAAAAATPGGAAADGSSSGVPASLTASSVEFSITWDRYRLFRAGSHEEAVAWVSAIRAVQAQRPVAPPSAAPAEPAYVSPGGGPQMPLQVDHAGGGGGHGSQAEEWGSSGGGKGRGGGGGGGVDAGGCCAVM